MSQTAILVDPGGPPHWFSISELAPFALLGAVWLIVAAVFALKGDDVDKPNRMAQLYGYTVCLVTLVVTLVSLASILNAAIDRANPLQSEFGFGTSFTSFEAYKATYRREQMMLDRGQVMLDRGQAAKPDTVPETALRQQYDALVKDRVAATRYRTTKSLTTGVIFLLISLALFLVHWRWVRRLNGMQRVSSSGDR